MTARRKGRFLLIGGGLLILAVNLLCTQPDVSISGNEASRFAVIEAWGERGEFAIERSCFPTVDRVERNGRRYSDKPLPATFLAGSLYGAFHKFTGKSFRTDYHQLVFRINALWGNLTALLLYWWLFNAFRRVRGGTLPLKAGLAAACVLTGWIFAYDTVLNNHTPAALAALGTFVTLEKFRRRPGMLPAALAGLSAGVLGWLDLPSGAVFGGMVLAVLPFSAPPGKQLGSDLAAGCAGAGTLIFHGLLNLYAYGTLLPLYVGTGGTFFAGTNKNWLEYAWENLLGARGLFSYQPFLLLAFPAVFALRKRLTVAERGTLLAVAGAVLLYLGITDEYGGAAYGFRYLIVTIPLLWYFAGRMILDVPRIAAVSLRAWKGAALALILWGAVTGSVGAYAPFCIAYEGYRSGPEHFTQKFRSTFLGNLFCMAWEFDPDGPVVKEFLRRAGERDAADFLFFSFFNRKQFYRLPAIVERFGRNPLQDPP